MKRTKLYNTTTTTKDANTIHIVTDYKHLANPLHLSVQQKFRGQVYDDRTKFKRSREKRNFQRDIISY